MSTKYNAGRGGHAPGHIREAFAIAFDVSYAEMDRSPWYERVELDLFTDPEQQAWWERITPIERGKWLIGQLWNCSDIMPSWLCEDLELPIGSTYARSVSKLGAEMD